MNKKIYISVEDESSIRTFGYFMLNIIWASIILAPLTNLIPLDTNHGYDANYNMLIMLGALLIYSTYITLAYFKKLTDTFVITKIMRMR